MREHTCFKSIIWGLTTLCILMMCTTFQYGLNKKEKPTIGLIRFSCDIYDKEKKKIVEKERQWLEDEIREYLKRKFSFKKKKHYFKKEEHVITYSDIEDPDVTIDPTLESRYEKTLKKLCGIDTLTPADDLKAVVFGHFQEDEDLVIVLRYYLADKNIPKEQRLIPLPPVTIPLDKVVNKGKEMRKAVTALLDRLKVKLEAEFTEDEQLEWLTAEDAFKMIINNGFYCEKIDSKFHNEGFKNIKYKNIKSDQRYIFPLSRIISSAKKGGGIIEVQAKALKANTSIDKNITTYWYPRIEQCTYEKAMSIVAELNRKKAGGFENWRIPTLKELLSIIGKGFGGHHRNHFPKYLKIPQYNNLSFWTSTAVKKEATYLKDQEGHRFYFVLEDTHSSSGNYSIRFSFRIDRKKNENRLLLIPVCSEKIYTYEPDNQGDALTENLIDDKIPGFDDMPNSTIPKDKKTPNNTLPKISTPKPQPIPGFDDKPDSDTSLSSIKYSLPKKLSTEDQKSRSINIVGNGNTEAVNSGLTPKRIKIGIFPYTYSGGNGSSKEMQFYNYINDIIEERLLQLDKDISRENINLVINKKRTYMKDNTLTAFYCSVSDLLHYGTSEEGRFFDDVNQKIMAPSNFDIIITVVITTEIRYPISIKIFRPLIISKISNSIHMKRFDGHPGDKFFKKMKAFIERIVRRDINRVIMERND